MTVAESPGITVAGRAFRPVTSRSDGKFVFDRWNWVTTALWSVDLEGADTLKQVMQRVAMSGQTAVILAGVVEEEQDGQPVPWTIDRAQDLQRFFAGPHDPTDCLTMQTIMLECLPRFFPGALRSWLSTDPALESPATPASISEDPTTSSATPSASSDPSSAPSPDMIPTSSPA